jgi:hypothetical protein
MMLIWMGWSRDTNFPFVAQPAPQKIRSVRI